MVDQKNGKAVRELHGWRFLGYSLGVFGIVLPFSLVNGYAFQFYVYTIGLDALIVSVGQFLGAIFFSIFSIIFGVIADNKTPTRLGKRRVVFLWGILPFSLISVLLWIPPWKCPSGEPFYLPTAIYFCVMMILYRIMNAMLLTTYNAIFPDISQSESNRIKVTGIQVLLITISSLIGMVLPVIFQAMVEDPLHTKWWDPSGETILQLIPWVGVILAGIAIIILLVTFASVDETFHYTNLANLADKDKDKKQISGLKETFQHIFSPMQDTNFKKLTGAIGLSEMAMIIQSICFIPFFTYVMKLQGMQFLWTYALGVPVLFIGIKIWQIILDKYGLLKGFHLNLLSSMFIALLSILFFLPLPFWVGYVIGAILLSTGIANSMGKYLFFGPMINHMIDISPLNTAEEGKAENPTKNISGAYVGMQLFVTNVIMGIANLILGIILSGSRAESSTFIIWTYLTLVVIFFLGWMVAKKIIYDTTDQK